MVAEHSFRGSSMSVGSGHHTWSRAGSSDNYLTGSDGDDSSNVEEWPAVRLKSVVVPVSNTQWGVVESRGHVTCHGLVSHVPASHRRRQTVTAITHWCMHSTGSRNKYQQGG